MDQEDLLGILDNFQKTLVDHIIESNKHSNLDHEDLESRMVWKMDLQEQRARLPQHYLVLMEISLPREYMLLHDNEKMVMQICQ